MVIFSLALRAFLYPAIQQSLFPLSLRGYFYPHFSKSVKD